MAKRLSSAKRTYTLRNAAAVVFALTSILPMLLFTYTLYALNKLGEMQAALGLGLALFFALIGGFIFMNLMGRLSELLHFIEEQGQEESAAPATAPNPSTASTPGVMSSTTGPRTAPLGAPPGPSGSPAIPGATPPPAAGRPMPVQPPRPVPTQPPGIVVPGLGTITARRPAPARAAGAFDDVQKSMWQAEAQRHLGQRVLVSVKNATDPIPGSLAQIADDGVLLEQNGERVAVSYLRITNIERDTKHAG
jgi:hypothetical protein